MKKKKFFIVPILIVLIFSLLIAIPYVSKFNYNSTNEYEALYSLCQISVFYNKDDFIIEYIPQLLNHDQNYLEDFQKDEFLSQYLNSVFELESFDKKQKALKESLSLFSSVETAIPSSTSLIFDFYNKTGDLESSKKLFEGLLEESENLHFEYTNGVYIKYMQFLLDVEDYKSFKIVKEERNNFLKSNGMDTDNLETTDFNAS